MSTFVTLNIKLRNFNIKLERKHETKGKNKNFEVFG